MSDDDLSGAFADLDKFLSNDGGMEYGSREMNEKLHAALNEQGRQMMEAIAQVRLLAEKRPRRIRAPSGKVYEIED